MAVDVAVMGGGFAGLTAANRCAAQGLSVVVLEAGTEPLYPCNSRISTGALHVTFRNPREPADALGRAILETSGGTARPDLAQAVAAHAAAAMDWAIAEGAAFGEHPRRRGGAPMMAPLRQMRAGLDWEASGPNLFLQTLESSLARRGGTLRRGARVTGLLRDGGRVAGVVVGDEAIPAAAVVIADGGFQADAGLLARHVTPAAGRLMQRNAGTGRGDGLRLAADAGAATVGLESFYGHVLSRDAMTRPGLWPYPQVDVICAKGVVVGPDGRRFADEGLGGIFMANAIARLPDPLSAVAVFDATVWDDARTTDNVPPNPALLDAGGTVIEAGGLAGLAAQAGIDPGGLAATVAAFNRGDRAPTRTTAVYPAHPVAQPPFYAIPLCAGITVTSGGLAVDGHGRVLDGADRPVAGLFAAGSAVGGIEGGPAAGYVGGLMKAFAIGLIAADTIVAQRRR